MTRPEIDDLKHALAAERERLFGAIAGISESQFKQRPPATASDHQPWCIAEVLAHLLWSERHWAERIDLALNQDGADLSVTAADEEEAAARAGRSAPVPQLIHGLLASRREVERLLDAAGAIEGGLERSAVHPRHGPGTVAWMVQEKVIGNEHEHLEQILALRVIVGATALGAAT